MFEQPTLQLPLFGGRAQGQKLEGVGIFEDLLGQIRVRRRQGTGKVGQGLPFPLPQLGGDVMGQHVTAPAVLEGGPQIPLPALPVLEPVEQDHMMTPGQFCSKLQNLRVRPGLGKGHACSADCGG